MDDFSVRPLQYGNSFLLIDARPHCSMRSCWKIDLDAAILTVPEAGGSGFDREGAHVVQIFRRVVRFGERASAYDCVEPGGCAPPGAAAADNPELPEQDGGSRDPHAAQRAAVQHPARWLDAGKRVLPQCDPGAR